MYSPIERAQAIDMEILAIQVAVDLTFTVNLDGVEITSALAADTVYPQVIRRLLFHL